MWYVRPFCWARPVCLCAFMGVMARSAMAGVITFSDQPAGDNFMLTTPYDSTTMNGLPTGVTLTFSSPAGGPGFESYNGTSTITDHTHLVTPSDMSNEFIFGDTSLASMTFNIPVDVTSLYIERNTTLGASNSRSASKPQPTITGYLDQVQVFSFTNTAAANAWVAVYGGTVDTLVFSAFSDNMVDDMDVELPGSGSPEPSTALLLSVGAVGLVGRINRRKCV